MREAFLWQTHTHTLGEFCGQDTGRLEDEVVEVVLVGGGVNEMACRLGVAGNGGGGGRPLIPGPTH